MMRKEEKGEKNIEGLDVLDPEKEKIRKNSDIDLEKMSTKEEYEECRDIHSAEPNDKEQLNLDYEGREFIVSDKETFQAQRDVMKLKVSQQIKRMISTGDCKKGDKIYPGRSERDMAIIVDLVAADYNFRTIESVFCNPHLGCSDRILKDPKISKEKLKGDVRKAIKFLSKEKNNLSPGEEAILAIKASGLKGDEKTIAISKFIEGDLFTNENSKGIGFKNQKRKISYYFDQAKRIPIDIDTEDFYCFLRSQYGLLDKEVREVVGSVRTAIWATGKTVEPCNFAYYDQKKEILYISNHDNGIYRLDGSKLDLVDNGTDGIFFEFKANYTPFSINPDNNGCTNYFEDGFDWVKFKSGDSLVYQHVVKKANFAVEEKHNLSAEEQEYLFSIYFYSLFFESILQDKPILCFVGVKASGKSFLATLIGKILFGNSFFPCHLPENRRDLQVILSENYYTVFDNLDSNISGAFLNDLCTAATGGEISTRKLYTNREEIKTVPRIFTVLTSREPKFRRDDFVDRLLLFNTEKVKSPQSRTFLNNKITDNREKILKEILVNLNSIVKLLKQRARWNPPGNFRLADWELFGKKIHSDENRNYFIRLLEKMNKEKTKFGLEEDPLYLILKNIIYELGRTIDNKSASELYELLEEWAFSLKINDFTKRYRGPISLGIRLSNIKEELCEEFDFYTTKSHGNVKLYNFSRKEEDENG